MVAVTALVVFVAPVAAQTASGSALADTEPAVEKVLTASPLAVPTPSSGASTLRCCNAKGALIGAAIGAGVGMWVTRHTCDAGDCTGNYVTAISVLGGLGGGIGALLDSNTGRVSFPERRFQVSGLVTSTVKSGALRLRF